MIYNMLNLPATVISRLHGIRSLTHLNGKVRILNYHSVSPKGYHGITPLHSIRAELFEHQLNLLQELGFKVIPLYQALNICKNPKESNERYISITFDDGFRNNYTVAWQLIKKFGFTAHFFLTAEAIGQKELYHWDRWHRNGVEVSEFSSIPTEFYPLTWEQVVEMEKEGATFGSHGYTHRRMVDLSDDEIKKELYLSKSILENKLRDKITTFSYPFGEFTLRLANQVKESGYHYAFSVKSGLVRIKKENDYFQINRMSSLESVSDKIFKNILSGGYDFLQKINVLRKNIERN